MKIAMTEVWVGGIDEIRIVHRVDNCDCLPCAIPLGRKCVPRGYLRWGKTKQHPGLKLLNTKHLFDLGSHGAISLYMFEEINSKLFRRQHCRKMSDLLKGDFLAFLDPEETTVKSRGI